LQASEKGLERLMAAIKTLEEIRVSEKSTVEVEPIKEKCFAALNDDLNSPIAIAHLFDGVKMINSLKAGAETISTAALQELKSLYNTMVFDILGLKLEDEADSGDNGVLAGAMELLIQLRKDAKANKDWGTADKIRDELNAIGIEIKDTTDGVDWHLK
jgi:cysteinyl-tRNA synthetase